MNFLSSLSAKNDLVSLLSRVRVGAHFPLESFFISLRSLFRSLAVLSGTQTEETGTCQRITKDYIEDYQIKQCILEIKVGLI